MQAQHFQQRLGDGSAAFVHRWLPRGRARAAVQILHGMAEHGGRYARLARALNLAGFAVYAQDLPGHGRSARLAEERGHISDDGGWQRCLSAVNGVRGAIEAELKQPPVFMFGHSMGSFLLQDYLVEHGRGLAGAVFSATTGDMGPLRALGAALIRAEALWFGARHRSAVGEFLSFRDFNRRFRPVRTAFDWLSRDEAEVDRYVADARCGFRCSCALWLDLLEAGKHLPDPGRLSLIPKALPVLAIAGSADPVTRGERGPRLLERNLRRANLKDITVRIYDGARHELLNETCRDEVTADLITWLRARV